MTSHELARWLLEHPDVPVGVVPPEQDELDPCDYVALHQPTDPSGEEGTKADAGT